MKRERGGRMLITFCIMMLFWILLSGLFDAFYLLAGVLCSATVSFISHDLLMKEKLRKKSFNFLKMFIYIPWEMWKIVLANIDVAYRVLHPRMPIDPRVIEFETTLRSDFALVTLANSITLTPGTVTISVEPEKGKFRVHALAKNAAEALLVEQTMQKKVAEVFLEE